MISLRTGLVLFVATSALACSSSSDVAHDNAGDPGSVQQEDTGACDRSPYNCKVPNAESIPSGIPHDTNRAFDHFDQSYFWPLIGEPALRDGMGNVRGYVAGGHDGHVHEVKLNFGERKTLGGVVHVYAFSVLLTSGNSVSGWIPEASVLRQATLAKMPSSAPKDPGTSYYDEDWIVTGGDLKADHSTLELNDHYGDLRVNPNVTEAEHASDYLVRQWDTQTHTGYVNFLYNLPHSGGVANDTLPMCVPFKRFHGVDQLETTLYFPGSPSESKLTLHFVFGTIHGRRGWITHEMLTPASQLASLDPSHPCHPAQGALPPPSLPTPPTPPSTPPTPPTPPTTPPAPSAPPVACHVLCCLSGAGTGDFSVASNGACIDQAQSFCDAHGHVQSASGDGASLFSRDGSTNELRCWAKCKNRVDYHEVTGVTDDCAGQAKAYCDVGDRGGLGDASWDRCNPN